jgi:hypothetical protein
LSEANLVTAILSLSAFMPDVELWRNNSGMRGYIRYGLHNRKRLKGSPDIVGIVAGRFVGLEVKTKDGVVSDEQHNFAMDIRAAGGYAAVVRSVGEALTAIQRAREVE